MFEIKRIYYYYLFGHLSNVTPFLVIFNPPMAQTVTLSNKIQVNQKPITRKTASKYLSVFIFQRLTKDPNESFYS